MIKRVVLSIQAKGTWQLWTAPSGCASSQPPSLRRPPAGNVQGLRGIHPPEFRLRVGDWRVRFHDHGDWIDVLRVRNRKDALPLNWLDSLVIFHNFREGSKFPTTQAAADKPRTTQYTQGKIHRYLKSRSGALTS